MSRRALLVHNPAAGRRGRRLRVALDALCRGGWAVEPVPTAGPGHATELARQAAVGGAEALFVLGGDGTVREAAAGLLDRPLPLGVLAGGTANVLARALGLPGSALRAAELLTAQGSRSVEMDVGSCAGRPFLMMVSSGLDARALYGLGLAAKRRFGRAAIVAAGLRAWGAAQPVIPLEIDGQPVAAGFVALCNIALYGGPFRLAPAARWDDRRLDLVALRSCRRASQLAFAVGVLSGRHLRRRDVLSQPVSTATFAGEGSVTLQIDGDPWRTELPVSVGIDPRRLSVLLPADRAR